MFTRDRFTVNRQSQLLLYDSQIIIIKINIPCPKGHEIFFHLSPVQQNSAALTSSHYFSPFWHHISMQLLLLLLLQRTSRRSQRTL